MSNIFDTQPFNKIDITCGSFSDKGIRKENQDSFLINKDIKYPTFIVADGAGGYYFGKEASSLAVNAFINELQNIENSNYLYVSRLIKKKYEQVNEYLYNKSIDKGKAMMTTFSMANIIEDKILISNLGDTAVFKISQGKIELVSDLHSLAWENYQRKLITYEEYLKYPKKNVITRALGGVEQAVPYYNTIDVKDKDIYVICSDGIYNFVRKEEIVSYFRNEAYSSEELDNICRSIGEEVLKRNGNDNLTIVAFQVFVL